MRCSLTIMENRRLVISVIHSMILSCTVIYTFLQRTRVRRYEVKKILSERKNLSGTRSYLIDWGIEHIPTWESDCPEMVASFNAVSN